MFWRGTRHSDKQALMGAKKSTVQPEAVCLWCTIDAISADRLLSTDAIMVFSHPNHSLIHHCNLYATQAPTGHVLHSLNVQASVWQHQPGHHSLHAMT